MKFSEVLRLTKVANHCITACEQHLNDHQGAQPHSLGRNRSPICNKLGRLSSGMRTVHYQTKQCAAS